MNNGVDLALIGTQLARLQAEMRELKLIVELAGHQHDALAAHVNSAIAGLQGRFDGLQGNIDARFEHVDEMIGELRQEMTLRLDRLEALLRAGR